MKKSTMIERRELLRWMVFSLPPAMCLTGCGSSSGGSPASTSAAPLLEPSNTEIFECTPTASCKPLAMLYSYSAASTTPTRTDLNATLDGVTTTADRFDDGKLCYLFNGTDSAATVHGISALGTAPYGISFWAKSANTAHMQIMQIAAGDEPLTIIDVNNQCGLGIYWATDFAEYTLSAGSSGQFTDGNWHHFLVQFDGTNLSAFVDGIPQGSVATRGMTGAGDLYIGGVGMLRWSGAIDDVRVYNRVFSAALAPQLVYAWTQAKPLTRNDSLIAYYPFDDNAVNENGKGFNGTLYDVTATADRYGQADRAYAFNGQDSYIELPTALGPIQGDYALAFWLQSTVSTEMTAYSVTAGATPGSADLNFVLNAGTALSVSIDGATPTSISYGSQGDLTDGTWHFILLQLAGSVYQLYVDGVLKGTMQNASSILTSDSVIRFGRASGSGEVSSDFWNGSLDDVQIYDTSFTVPEIQALMQLQFLPRDGGGALVFQNKMWLLGGWNPANELSTNSEVWSSADGSNWSFICDAPWERRHMAGWLVYDDRLWVVGGDNNTGHYQNDVWSSVDGINWVEETDSVPWANRATQMTTVFNGSMWLMGGQQLNLNPDVVLPPGVAYNDVYSSTDGKNWTLVTQNAGWSPRGQMIGNVVYGGKMWVLGGGTYDIRTYLNDVWNSPDGVNWTQVTASAPWAGRQYHDVAVFDNKIWVVAGGTYASEGGSTDVWYSTDGLNWSNLAGTPWLMRHAASVWVFQNSLWFGCGSDSAVYNDIWKLTYAE